MVANPPGANEEKVGLANNGSQRGEEREESPQHDKKETARFRLLEKKPGDMGWRQGREKEYKGRTKRRENRGGEVEEESYSRGIAYFIQARGKIEKRNPEDPTPWPGCSPEKRQGPRRGMPTAKGKRNLLSYCLRKKTGDIDPSRLKGGTG